MWGRNVPRQLFEKLVDAPRPGVEELLLAKYRLGEAVNAALELAAEGLSHSWKCRGRGKVSPLMMSWISGKAGLTSATLGSMC